MMREEFYVQCRHEVRDHHRVRDQTLLLYLVAVGVIAGLSSAADSGIPPFVFVPFLALATSLVFAQRELYLFLANKYGADLAGRLELEEEAEGSRRTPSWDKLEDVSELRAYLFPVRTAAYGLLVILPSVLSLLLGFPSDWSRPFQIVAWAAGIPITFLTLVVFAATYLLRNYWFPGGLADPPS